MSEFNTNWTSSRQLSRWFSSGRGFRYALSVFFISCLSILILQSCHTRHNFTKRDAPLPCDTLLYEVSSIAPKGYLGLFVKTSEVDGGMCYQSTNLGFGLETMLILFKDETYSYTTTTREQVQFHSMGVWSIQDGAYHLESREDLVYSIIKRIKELGVIKGVTPMHFVMPMKQDLEIVGEGDTLSRWRIFHNSFNYNELDDLFGKRYMGERRLFASKLDSIRPLTEGIVSSIDTMPNGDYSVNINYLNVYQKYSPFDTVFIKKGEVLDKSNILGLNHKRDLKVEFERSRIYRCIPDSPNLRSH